MKIRFYCDFIKGYDPSRQVMFATTGPSTKCEGFTRIAFDVTIPDHLVLAVDAVAPEVSKIDVIGDE